MHNAAPPRRFRLNWFSPLRGASTAIADYAVGVLPALAQLADLTVWAERDYWPLEIERYARVRHWDGKSWDALNSADATLYHLGNNALFHGWIWNAARLNPGIVVLHDTRLNEFFSTQLLGSAGETGPYLDAVRRLYGDAAAFQAERMLRGEVTANELAEGLPMTELAVERARGAVVHTAAAFEQVAAIGRCSVLQLDLPFSAGPPPAPRDWDGVLRLVVFGYLGANRRLDQLLEAIATFPDRDRLQLDILGQHYHPDTLTGRISELALDGIVRVRGFVPAAELDATLDRSHLAINLRYPTMGEASDSQLRIWSRSLASLVTRTGWYAELPPETVWFVDPQNEVADLHVHFRAALAAPRVLQQMGDAGRRRLEQWHQPARYANELLRGVDRMMRTPASIIWDIQRSIARVAGSGMTGSVHPVVASRMGREVARWIGSSPDADPLTDGIDTPSETSTLEPRAVLSSSRSQDSGYRAEFLLREDQIRDRSTLEQLVKAINADGGTYHQLDLRPDLRVAGDYDMKEYVDTYRIPADLTGLKVLDMGTASGYFALECARRGGDVVAVDLWDAPPVAEIARSVDVRIRYVQSSIYALDASLGPFDVIICGSMLLHLPDQLGALAALKKVCRGRLCVSTACPLDDNALRPRAVCEFVARKGQDGSYYTYWHTSEAALRQMLLVSGFTTVTNEARFSLKSNEGRRRFDAPHIVMTALVE